MCLFVTNSLNVLEMILFSLKFRTIRIRRKRNNRYSVARNADEQDERGI